jgi:PucR-like helix-turn-helix protein/diguanylate cyclase with GGDEF domain
MCAAVVEHAAVEGEVRAERRRILVTLLDELDELSERGVVALRAEIPAYRDGDARFVEDLREQVRSHYRVKLAALLEDRMVTLQDIAFVRAAATRRARAGFALEDYLNAFRVGQQAFWEAVVACAGETPLGQAAALTVAGPLMRYCDFASTHAAHAYVEYQQYMVADADRERRDLLEHLLAGELPTRGPLLSAAQAHGIAADSRMLVAAAVPVDAGVDADATHVGSAAIACAGLHDAKTLVVVRQTEIVAILVLGADADPCRLCDRVDALQRRLCGEGVSLAMGVSTVATGVENLPRAYQEAHVALGGVGEDGGVEALARLTPFDYLALRADDTARRLVNPQLRAFLDEDRRRGRVLTETIRAVADADLNLRVAAERLQVHPNTAQYRLRRIEERTGRNPRRIADLLDLLVAIALDDALAAPS